MKIVMVIPSLHMGGGEKFAVDLANELAKNENNNVTICVLSKIDKNMVLSKSISSYVRLVSLEKNAGFDYKILFKLRRFLLNHQFDIVHTHLRGMLYSAWSIFSIKNIQYIHTFHTLVEKEVSSLPYKILLKFFFSYRNVIPVAITPTVLEGMQLFFGRNQKEMILNGVSPLKKSSKFKEIREEISQYKENERTKVIMNIARVTEVKNQKLLVEIFQLLKEKNILLVIIGSLSNEELYAKECQDLASNSNNILFLGEKYNVGDYLHCADALCLSSIFEGLPLVVLEAMSVGKPVLSTNVGGIPDVIKHGINGYITADLTAKSYVTILNEFIENSTIESETILSIFKKNYSMKICSSFYENIYQSSIKKRK